MMTIEEKAKRYDEAIKRVEDIMTGKCKTTFMFTEGLFEHIFPALKESEGEKIRKGLLYVIEHHPTLPTEEAEEYIAWIEKQGEKDEEILILKDQVESLHAAIKVIKETHRIELEKQGEHARFCDSIQIGDKVTRNQDGVLVNLSQLERVAKSADKVESKFKVGDKIRRKNPSSCDEDMQVSRIFNNYYVCNHIGKFSSEVVPFSKQSSYELVEQKSTWSEDDEQRFNNLCKLLDGFPLSQNWLKSLKDRVQHQSTCKPSDRELGAILAAIGDEKQKGSDTVNELLNIYQQLKKLREE